LEAQTKKKKFGKTKMKTENYQSYFTKNSDFVNVSIRVNRTYPVGPYIPTINQVDSNAIRSG